MSNVTLQLETDSVCANDPRWELVERIIASPYFVKSPRLCSILSFICELSLQGRDEEINELNIGTSLFGRAPNYDPSVDGIVRSHASRLRQRLEQYFKGGPLLCDPCYDKTPPCDDSCLGGSQTGSYLPHVTTKQQTHYGTRSS